MEQAHLFIRGKVQGVFYRQSMRDAARELHLRGWVKNLPNGMVEAEVRGERASIEKLIAWCANGPPRARVDKVDANWLTVSNEADENAAKEATMEELSSFLIY